MNSVSGKPKGRRQQKYLQLFLDGIYRSKSNEKPIIKYGYFPYTLYKIKRTD
jgi:hypothetical protein